MHLRRERINLSPQVNTSKLFEIFKNLNAAQANLKMIRPFGITILSCLWKLFTSVLCNRLCTYLEYFAVIKENQCGFRPKYSTTDNIFTLYSFVEILKCKNKKETLLWQNIFFQMRYSLNIKPYGHIKPFFCWLSLLFLTIHWLVCVFTFLPINKFIKDSRHR